MGEINCWLCIFPVKQTMRTEDKGRAKLKGVGEGKQSC